MEEPKAPQDWLTRVLAKLMRRSDEEGKEIWKEFTGQIRKGLVGAFIAIVLVILGFPKMVEWYDNYREKQLNPSRTVYLDFEVLKAHELTPLDSVYVQIQRNTDINGYTNAEGRLRLEYEAETGENTINMTLFKPGFETRTIYHFALPDQDGEATIERVFQMDPVAEPPQTNPDQPNSTFN